MGHAFQMTLMDVLIRYHRMRGDNTLVAARHRPCRHRDADRRRAAIEGARRVAPRARPREIRATRLGVEGSLRFDDHESDAKARLVGRLVARAIHDGRRAFRGGAGNVRPAV